MTLSFDPETLSLAAMHWINGAPLLSDGRGREISLRRPCDGAALPATPVAEVDIVDQAVSVARAAWNASGWGAVRPRDRVRVLHKWADLVHADAAALARLEVVPSTRLIGEAIGGDIAVCVEQIRFFAEMADKEGGALAPTDHGHLGFTLTEPYGVIAAITPWNYPLSMAVWKLAPALAAGNAVVIKPSEMTPYSVVHLVRLAEQAGLPKGLVNVLQGDGPTTGAALVSHPGIGKVSFTGSTRAGAEIQAALARTGLKPVTLELGGKSPQVVFPDADFDLAMDCVARGFLPNAGQTCVAGTRLILHESLADRAVARLRDRITALTPGPTWEETTTFSPLISEAQCDRVATILDAARVAGAETLTGGARMDRPGAFFEPTLLTGLSSDNPALTQEIFGPVLTIQTFQDDDQALALADHPSYGLCAGVHTKDISRALRMTRQIEAGTVWVNRYGRSRDHILPTGGYKASGQGKDLGREAYHGAMRVKSVLIEI